MRIIKQFSAEHKDFIHDVAFDFYGRRIATCSSDQCLSVWDYEGGEWRLHYQWKAHKGSVWRVAWAHPEYGQILASCSYDRSVVIWEEPPHPSTHHLYHQQQQQYSQNNNNNNNNTPNITPTTTSSTANNHSLPSWWQRASLPDHRDSVQDIAFAPPHLGLRLATASLDGTVRIYEAGKPMNLTHWPLVQEYDVSRSAGVNCIAWCPSRFHRPMLAVGCNDPSGTARILVSDPSDASWSPLPDPLPHTSPVRSIAWAPAMGRSYHLLATASGEGGGRPMTMTKTSGGGGGDGHNTNDGSNMGSGSGGSGSSGSSSMNVSGTTGSGEVQIFRLEESSGSDPSTGSYRSSSISGSSGGSGSGGGGNNRGRLTVKVEQKLEVTGTPWKVEWNVSGTVLAVSADDGTVQLFRRTAGTDQRWVCVSLLHA